MEKTSEELPNFSICIDLLGPDPTSSKNKTELKKNSQVARRSQICRRPAAANFGRKTFTGNRTDTNWSSTTFKGENFRFYCCFYICYALLLSPDNPTEAGKFLSQ